MIIKPSFCVGIDASGAPHIIAVGDAETCKQAFTNERENPSGKYVSAAVYRKPPYWKRADIAISKKPKKTSSKKG